MGAVGLEQRGGRLHGLHQLLVVAGAGPGARRRLRRGARGGGGRGGSRRGRELGQLDPEVREDLLVEGLVALQQRLDALEEAAGLRALDDPVVVGGGHRHDLLGADHRAHPLQPDRIGDRAGGHDRALAHHQTRHRGDGADPAGVGERDVAAGEVVGGERVGPRLLHQRVVGVQELGEAHASGVADDRHHQRAGAVLLLHVHGQAEVDGAVVMAVGLAVDLLEVVGHHRHVPGGDLGDGVGDQVGEGDPLAPVLELLAPLVERGHGQGAERGGRRDRAALVHVAGQRGAAALDELRSRGRPGGNGWGSVAVVEDVGLGDPAAPGTTLDRREVHPLGGRHAAGYRRGVAVCAVARGRCGGRGRARGGAGRAGLRGRRGRRSAPAIARWRARAGGRGADAHPGDDLPDGDRLTLLGEDLGDRAVGGSGQLHVDLVGGDLDDGVAVLDRVAHLDRPLEDRPLGDRLATRGGDDVHGLAGSLLGRRDALGLGGRAGHGLARRGGRGLA